MGSGLPDLNDKLVRRRNRTVLVCNVCKYRKVKCDRKKPCNSCLKYKTAHVCNYQEETWTDEVAAKILGLPLKKSRDETPNDSNDEEHGKKRAKTSPPTPQNGVFLQTAPLAQFLCNFSGYRPVIGVNPIGNANETISFYQDYVNAGGDREKPLRWLNLGPFSWHALVRKDVGLFDLWSVLHARLRQSPAAPDDTNSPPYVLKRIRESAAQRFGSSDHGLKLPLGLTFSDPDPSKDASLLQKMQVIIPLNYILWSHVDQFFKTLYPFYPFLDETRFRLALCGILGPQNYSSTKPTISVKSDTEYAIVGTLFVIIRLSYLSLITNSKEKNDFNVSDKNTDPSLALTKLLLLDPIGIEFADLAGECLRQFSIFQKTGLETIQLALYFRIYSKRAPENAEGPLKNHYQVFDGLLIQMAYLMGLNREPDEFSDILHDPKTNNIRRKVWHHLVHADLSHALVFGSPYITSERFVDVKFPFLDSTNGNCLSPNMDVHVVASMLALQTVNPRLKDVLKLVLEVRHPVSMLELTSHINDLELTLNLEYGTFEDFSDIPKLNITKMLQISFYIPIRLFIVSIYFHFFLHYERSQNYKMSFFYFKKLLSITVCEFLTQVVDFLDSSHPYFKESFHLHLNNSICAAMQKSIMFYASIFIRLACTMRMRKDQDEKMVSACSNLHKMISRCMKLSVIAIAKLGHRDSAFWRISMSLTFLFKKITSEAFVAINVPQSQELELHYECGEVEEVAKMIDTALMRNDLQSLKKEWKVMEDNVEQGAEVVANESQQQHNSLWETLNTDIDVNSAMGQFFDLEDATLNLFGDDSFSPVFNSLMQ